MARIFITGSSDGLGFLAAKELMANGHQVVLHARNAKRKEETEQKMQGVETILTADLSSTEETINLAHKVNSLGTFDAIIHNAGVYTASATHIFAVNVLAPYMLTSLIRKPKRLVYLTSGMHLQGEPKLEHIPNDIQSITYSDSKLHVLMLCKAIARIWPEVYANAVDPGWVPTKMGGSQATDNLQKGFGTQVWLTTSDDEKAKVSGSYFFHRNERPYHTKADNVPLQGRLLGLCHTMTGVTIPG